MSTDGPNPDGYCMCGCGERTPIATRNSGGNLKGHPKKYVSVGHANTARTGFTSMADRFWSKADKSGGVDACWPWLGYIAPQGHGQFAPSHGKSVPAHRVAYELSVGPIPEGLVIDHLCHSADPTCFLAARCPHRRCVNPAHLEPVTLGMNVLRSYLAPPAVNARKTHCKRGHEFAGANLYVDHRGSRQCRECRRDSARARYHSLKESA